MKNLFKKRPAFVAYLTAGQRGLNFTKEAAIALAKGGVDLLEIGVPFSDPIADGPVIAQAMNEALSYPITLHSILNTIHEIKQVKNIPIVLFTYFNPLFKTGITKIMKEAKQAGVDAILTVDCPLEESSEYFSCAKSASMDTIGLISPSTEPERILKICQSDPAFLYYICRNGITGVKDSLPEDYLKKIAQIKSLSIIPVIAGFGISTKEMASSALECADGFVVGSLFVKAIADGISPLALQQLAINLDPREETLL